MSQSSISNSFVRLSSAVEGLHTTLKKLGQDPEDNDDLAVMVFKLGQAMNNKKKGMFADALENLVAFDGCCERFASKMDSKNVDLANGVSNINALSRKLQDGMSHFVKNGGQNRPLNHSDIAGRAANDFYALPDVSLKRSSLFSLSSSSSSSAASSQLPQQSVRSEMRKGAIVAEITVDPPPCQKTPEPKKNSQKHSTLARSAKSLYAAGASSAPFEDIASLSLAAAPPLAGSTDAENARERTITSNFISLTDSPSLPGSSRSFKDSAALERKGASILTSLPPSSSVSLLGHPASSPPPFHPKSASASLSPSSPSLSPKHLVASAGYSSLHNTPGDLASALVMPSPAASHRKLSISTSPFAADAAAGMSSYISPVRQPSRPITRPPSQCVSRNPSRPQTPSPLSQQLSPEQSPLAGLSPVSPSLSPLQPPALRPPCAPQEQARVFAGGRRRQFHEAEVVSSPEPADDDAQTKEEIEFQDEDPI